MLPSRSLPSRYTRFLRKFLCHFFSDEMAPTATPDALVVLSLRGIAKAKARATSAIKIRFMFDPSVRNILRLTRTLAFPTQARATLGSTIGPVMPTIIVVAETTNDKAHSATQRVASTVRDS
jgi:hypothetical protein